MKILLTSTGIWTQELADALDTLTAGVNKKIGFISTAANVQEGNKDWFINQFVNLRKYGYDWIDIVDISALGVDWRTRLAETDIIFVSGGNTCT